MLDVALERGFQPLCVLFDSWYSSLENLKRLRKNKLRWLTQLKKNRLVDYGERIEDKTIPDTGLRVHLRGYGFIRVFQTDTPQGVVKYWATSDEELSTKEFYSRISPVYWLADI